MGRAQWLALGALKDGWANSGAGWGHVDTGDMLGWRSGQGDWGGVGCGTGESAWAVQATSKTGTQRTPPRRRSQGARRVAGDRVVGADIKNLRVVMQAYTAYQTGWG